VKETDLGPTSKRSFPADPTCNHDVKNGKCFCIDKQVEWLTAQIRSEFPNDAAFEIFDVEAPFHKAVLKYTQQNTFSYVAFPLLPNIPLKFRVPGIWHCIYNCRHAMWILMKDGASAYGSIAALQEAMNDLGMTHIKVAAADRPKSKEKGDCIDAVIARENEDMRQTKATEEAASDVNKRGNLTGKEHSLVLGAFDFISTRMLSKMEAKHQRRAEKWQAVMQRAIQAFNQGAAIALADMWETNRSAEMGGHFRDWADELVDGIGPQVGINYLGRTYINILPAHWLCERDHLQESSSEMWELHGVAPGSGTDSTCEMVT
jgi:hypothetical protein